MKLNTQSDIFKQAVWEVHKKRCYYSGRLLRIHEMELDHVIPKHLMSKPDELDKVLKRFNLESDFQITNNALNLVPCSSIENKKKGSWIHPNTSMILMDLESKAKNVEKRIIKISEEDDIDRSKSSLKSDIKAGNTDFEELSYFLKDEKPVYEVSESYNDDFHHAHYCRSTKRIFLNGFLPRPSSEVSSCCVSFKSLEIKGLMFTMTEKEVFELTDSSHEEETLKIQPNPNHYPDLKGTAFFKYNGVNFFLGIEEIKEFYDVLNTYREKIEIHKGLLNQFYGSEKFELSKSKENYRLGKIKRKLWTLMLDFAQEHDFGRGGSEWHMFDAKHNILLASSGRDCSNYNMGFHAMFLPEQIEQNDFCDFRHVDDEMWILWRKMEPSDGAGDFTSYSIRDRWNAEMSYKWMTEDFIPYVIWYYEVSKKDRLLKYGSYNKFKSRFDINQYIWN